MSTNIPRAHKNGGGGGGEERVTAHPGCGLGESVALCLNILFIVRLQTNCEVFQWMPSITAFTTDRWLANRKRITHTASC